MTRSDDRDPLSDDQHWQLREMYVKDRQLDREPTAQDLRESIPLLAKTLAADEQPLVYTAFDGDLFDMAPQMRTYVLRCGGLPANPESIVGYHDSVLAHGARKDLVLADDLAILKGCDALWVFTDAGATAAEAMDNLAEGVLVELLFHLERQEVLGLPAGVFFIPTANLFGGTKDPVPYLDDYATTRLAVKPDQEGILDLLGKVKLPEVVYIAHDPLDTKHVHWLRPFAYSRRVVPVVSTLALELSDAQLVWPENALAKTMSARARLMRLADRLWILPPQHGRAESYTVQILRHLSLTPPVELSDKVWSEMEIPKATDVLWHITQREAAALHA